MSTQKEPHHFSRGFKYKEGASAHNDLFKGKPEAHYFGESSTTYLPWKPSIERISRDLDSPKIIIILRHPVERSFSHYRWRYRLGLEKRSFLNAVKVDGFGFNPEKQDGFGFKAYLEFSKYSLHCPEWEKYIGSENCLFLRSVDLLQDRQTTLERCFDFLDLPLFQMNDLSHVKNETNKIGRRSTCTMTMIAGILPAGLKTSSTYRNLKGGVLRAAAPKPPISMNAEEEGFLKEQLAEDIDWYENRFLDTERVGQKRNSRPSSPN